MGWLKEFVHKIMSSALYSESVDIYKLIIGKPAFIHQSIIAIDKKSFHRMDKHWHQAMHEDNIQYS